jgi:hypothetical protein
MRTTTHLEDHLLKEARSAAAESGRTLTQFVEDALREKLARRRQLAKRPRVMLHTFKGNGIRPGVDLDDSAALLDLMEGRGPS